ncbi:MAG: hypothetical protein AB8B50_20970 [Pirellulaceae bacterium]
MLPMYSETHRSLTRTALFRYLSVTLDVLAGSETAGRNVSVDQLPETKHRYVLLPQAACAEANFQAF